MVKGLKIWLFPRIQCELCGVIAPLPKKSGQLYKEGVSISKITAFVWKRL